MSPSIHFERLRAHLVRLYPDHDPDDLVRRVLDAIGIPVDAEAPSAPPPHWHSTDAVLITYADSVIDEGRAPLTVLADVMREVGRVLPIVHVLPFFPASSDRGFAVIDHAAVEARLGTWADVERLSEHADLMVDLVCNHVSSRSGWFRQFLRDEEPGRRYVLSVPEGTDVSLVVRPRSRPLLERVPTASGDRLVWCTFGPDQVDVDYRNPQVLVEMLRFVDLYLTHGARLLRLDAVAYLWKEPGTSCIHLPATHEIVRLLRTLLEVRSPRACIVTETNVPDEENRSYFGDGDEAHVVYNFTLPPLLIHALLTGRAELLGSWLAAGPIPPAGCTFLNFVASHDGIGLRPAEGLLGPDDLDELVAVTERRGGFWSSYDTPAGPRPYELNIALWDLLEGTIASGDDGLVVERFVCAHAVVLGMAGIPAIYVNNFFAQPGDRAAAVASGIARDITRGRLDFGEAMDRLADEVTPGGRATAELVHLLGVRAAQTAFHPEASLEVVLADGPLLAFERAAPDGSQTIVAVSNLGPDELEIPLDRVGIGPSPPVGDLLSGGEPCRSALTLAPYQTMWLTSVGG